MVNGGEQLEQYMVECGHKKRILLIQASSSVEERNDINSLHDELLVEILCRLPCSNSVIQCKRVCKRWAALITQPNFVCRFIASKVEGLVPCIENAASRFDRTDMKGRSFAIVARNTETRISCDTWVGLTMLLKDPVSNLHDFTLSPLPCLEDGNATPLVVVGACSDLLLYCRSELDRCNYYICNVQTTQWLQLPSPPSYKKSDPVGFICDPCYSIEGGNPSCKVILNAASIFSVVVVPYTPKAASKFGAHMFSSHTNQWTKIVLSLPSESKLIGGSLASPFVFDGRLHIRFSGYIMSFDPYEGKNSVGGVIQCHPIGWPARFSACGHAWVSCEGHLQLSHFDDDGKLYTWVLKDYKAGEWFLQHSIGMQEWVPRERCLTRYLEKGLFPGRILGQHPTNPDIVYVFACRKIVMCNASKRTVEVASCISRDSLRFDFISFQLKLPIWPTPVPNAPPLGSVIE